jgi:hypothetical protein
VGDSPSGDGTARVQTVRQETNERLYQLIKEFDALTGVPVLLNTSFNVKGEPIVEAPRDALQCFLSTGIDYLVLHNMLIVKRRAHRALSPILRMYSEMGRWSVPAWALIKQSVSGQRLTSVPRLHNRGRSFSMSAWVQDQTRTLSKHLSAPC